MNVHACAFFPLRSRPLAACIAALFGVIAPTACANTFVTNCNDAGTGSLRSAVGSAIDGDTVDATALTAASPGCAASTITLKTGDIVTPAGVNNLRIHGPGIDVLTVTAYSSSNQHQYPNRIFTHSGTGTLYIKDLSMRRGYVAEASGIARGGCIYSKGAVTLVRASVSHCGVYIGGSGLGSRATGGGIDAHGLTMSSSTLEGNSADGILGPPTAGGGAYITGNLQISYSNIAGNSSRVTGGGVVAVNGASIFILYSTISGNQAGSDVGGLTANASEVRMYNSTISGNHALSGQVGGLNAVANAIVLYNSTIAFNDAHDAATLSPGLALRGTGASATLVSNLVSNNTYNGSSNNDVTASGVVVSGHSNLVFAPDASLPGDTLVGKCPLLGPLRNNGGPTRTHALMSLSPAIDTGSDNNGLLYDQRGYSFTRVSGASYGTDIGAYEVQQNDIVFNASFDGC